MGRQHSVLSCPHRPFPSTLVPPALVPSALVLVVYCDTESQPEEDAFRQKYSPSCPMQSGPSFPRSFRHRRPRRGCRYRRLYVPFPRVSLTEWRLGLSLSLAPSPPLSSSPPPPPLPFMQAQRHTGKRLPATLIVGKLWMLLESVYSSVGLSQGGEGGCAFAFPY